MASGPITSWEIDGETVEAVSDFIFLGSKITTDGDCSHEIKRRLLSRVQLLATPWTVAHQAPLSLGFSRQEYWSGLPCPSPGDLPNPLTWVSCIASRFFIVLATMEALYWICGREQFVPFSHFLNSSISREDRQMDRLTLVPQAYLQ